jgi:hypothetical protein
MLARLWTWFFSFLKFSPSGALRKHFRSSAPAGVSSKSSQHPRAYWNSYCVHWWSSTYTKFYGLCNIFVGMVEIQNCGGTSPWQLHDRPWFYGISLWQIINCWLLCLSRGPSPADRTWRASFHIHGPELWTGAVAECLSEAAERNQQAST